MLSVFVCFLFSGCNLGKISSVRIQSTHLIGHSSPRHVPVSIRPSQQPGSWRGFSGFARGGHRPGLHEGADVGAFCACSVVAGMAGRASVLFGEHLCKQKWWVWGPFCAGWILSNSPSWVFLGATKLFTFDERRRKQGASCYQ